jgi:hypothetical protein
VSVSFKKQKKRQGSVLAFPLSPSSAPYFFSLSSAVMIVEAAAFVAVLFLCWYLNFRPRSTNQIKPCYKSCRRPEKVSTCDYVVVGAGVAGLAAVASLLHEAADDTHVLLVEGGTDPQATSALTLLLSAGRRDRLLSFAPDLVRVPAEALPPGVQPTFAGLPTPDEGYLVQRPWHFSSAEEKVVTATSSGASALAPTATSPPPSAAEQAKANRYRLLQYTPFPRGVGVGGTSLLDWGMHLNSVWAAHDVASTAAVASTSRAKTALWARLPVHFPDIRNPLSWAFAETVKATGLVPPHLPTPDAPVEQGTVFPAYLYLDKDGRRLALPSSVLADIAPDVLHRRLSVLTGYRVVDVVLDGDEAKASNDAQQKDRRVRSVCVRRSGAPETEKLHTIGVAKGVVVTAGVIHSPQLLHDIFSGHKLPLPRPLPCTVSLRDALALPLIFPAMPSISADAFNARDMKSSAMWWLTQRGPFLAPLSDTCASLPLPKLGPQAELRIVLLPFGGRDAARFKSMGWDTVLATPLQAYTMLMIVQGIDGLQHELTLDKTVTPPGAVYARGLCPHHTAAALPDEVHHQVQEAFLYGIKECRRLTKESPLSSLSLSPGAESVDFTLLIPRDEAKAVRLAQLSRQMPSKRTARNKAELNELMRWAKGQSTTEAYMRRYVDAHAYWLGFASGSSEAFLDASAGDASMRVAGMRNVVVGDLSAVTTEQWSGVGRRDTLAAGSRSTAMHAAEKAVAELVSQS